MVMPIGDKRQGLTRKTCPSCDAYAWQYFLGESGYVGICALCEFQSPRFGSVEAIEKFFEYLEKK